MTVNTVPATPYVDQFGHVWLVRDRAAGRWALGFDFNSDPCLRLVSDDDTIVTDLAQPNAERRLLPLGFGAPCRIRTERHPD